MKQVDIDSSPVKRRILTHITLVLATMAKIRAISEESRLAHIVMGISHGMTSLHGELLNSEKTQIAGILKLPSEIEDLAGVIKQ
jgi:hypothetical protein